MVDQFDEMVSRQHGQEPVAQAAAVPYCYHSDGSLMVMLIRRRHKRRWGIPKGIIAPGQTARQTALEEALEEAGVEGELSRQVVGEYEYPKWNRTCHVQVFLLHVTREMDRYKEESFRERQWFTLKNALDRKTRKGIRPLLVELPTLLKERR